MRAIELPAEGPATSDYAEPDDQTPTPEQQARERVRAFLQRSRKQFLTADAASSGVRRKMREDQIFAAGDGNQWNPEDRSAREVEGRPCLEINRIPQFIRQVSNQNRANRSQIVVKPKGRGSDVKLASAVQGLIRHVEIDSDADIAYDTAMEHQLRSGMGFVRLMATWATPDSIDEQACRLARIRNPLAVYWDPSAQDNLFFDSRWMHIIGAVGQDEYDDRWGTVSPRASLTEFMQGRTDLEDWAPEGKVIVAEYYYVTVEQRLKLRLQSGHQIFADDLEKFMALWQLSHPGQPNPVVRQRQVDVPTVRWCFHNAVDILEGNEDRTEGRILPGTRIPVIPLIGDEIDLDGKVDYRGMVRDARQPQQMYNFWATSIAEAVALTPKAPWIAAKGQVENYIDEWKNANREAKAVLLYDPVAVGDKLEPPPQRNVIGADIQAMVMGLTQADRDLMSVMGLFQPSLGERGSSSESGRARETLVQQGIVANSNYLDNLQRTKRAVGRLLLEWIPVIYDVPRIVHLVQPDGSQREAVVYAGAENKPAEDEFPDISDIFDVSELNLDVSVSTGPSFQSEQERTQAWLLDLFKVMPPLAEMGVDILLEHSTHPAGQQLAKRAKKALPPQFQDENGSVEDRLARAEGELQMKTAILEKAHQAIIDLTTKLETKELDATTKKQVAMIQASAQMAIAQSKLANERDLEVYRGELARLQQAVDHINQQTIVETQQQAAERLERQRQADQMAQAGGAPPGPGQGA